MLAIEGRYLIDLTFNSFFLAKPIPSTCTFGSQIPAGILKALWIFFGKTQ